MIELMIVVLLLILAVLLGLGMTFFANQNPTHVDITLGSITWHGVPLYMIVAFSLLFGLLIAWVFGVINSLTSSITVLNKDAKIKKKNQEVNDLNNRVVALETENKNLKQGISPA